MKMHSTLKCNCKWKIKHETALGIKRHNGDYNSTTVARTMSGLHGDFTLAWGFAEN